MTTPFKADIVVFADDDEQSFKRNFIKHLKRHAPWLPHGKSLIKLVL